MKREIAIPLMNELLSIKGVLNIDFNQDDNEFIKSFFTAFRNINDNGSAIISEGTRTLEDGGSVVLQYDNLYLIVGERYAPIRGFINETLKMQ